MPERKDVRTMYLTARTMTKTDALGKVQGGRFIPEPELLQLLPQYLENELTSARPTLQLVDLRAMVEECKTQSYHNLDSRVLGENEVTFVREYLEAAEADQKKKLGERTAAAINTITGQASQLHQETTIRLQRLEAMVEEGFKLNSSISGQRSQLAERTRLEKIQELKTALEYLGKPVPENIEHFYVKGARWKLGEDQGNGLSLRDEYQKKKREDERRKKQELTDVAALRRQREKLKKESEFLRQEVPEDLERFSLEEVAAHQGALAQLVSSKKASLLLARKRRQLQKQCLSLHKLVPASLQSMSLVDVEKQLEDNATELNRKVEDDKKKKYGPMVRLLAGQLGKPLAENFEALDSAELQQLLEDFTEEEADRKRHSASAGPPGKRPKAAATAGA